MVNLISDPLFLEINRLVRGYFGPKLGNRVIDLAIKGVGLDKFYL